MESGTLTPQRLPAKKGDQTRLAQFPGGIALETIGRALASRATFFFACAAFLILQLFGGVAVNALDSSAAALRMHMIRSAPSGNLVVVTIDTASLQAHNVWPWPRERYARAIENLQAAGADLVAFDVDFSAVSTSDGDAALKEAVDALPGSVVLPTFLQSDAEFSNQPTATVGDTAILGNANVEIGRDGKVRRYSNGYELNGVYRPTLAAVLADAAYGDTASFKLDFGVRAADIPTFSFEDIYSGRFDPSAIAGRDVLIGATAFELGDTFAIPTAPAMPGVFVHAVAYENIVSGRMLLELTRPLTIGAGFVALLLLWPRRPEINLRRLFALHTAIGLAVFLAPFAVQTLAPVSLNLFSILLAQGLCAWAGVRRELDRRSAEIIRQREAQLNYIATHDPETGLPNRRAMLAHVDELLASEDASALRVMAIGVDRFGTLRAALGFTNANDAILRFCQQLETTFPGTSTYRLSASLLGVVSNPVDDPTCGAWMRTGFPDVDMAANVAGQEIQLRVRTGSASGKSDSSNAEDLIERSTIALDAARRSDLLHLNFEEMETIDPRLRLAMVSGVEQGMELGEFELAYQSKVSAADGSVCGAEALLRWDHPQFGRLSPAEFIPVAEQTGAIDRLTLWILDRVIADQRAARSQGIHLPISVNLSARTLNNERFCELAIQKIERNDADICFEITETAAIRSESAAAQTISTFRAAGIKISIDDFGAGLSSLSYLKTFEADELKLDKSLIADIASSDRDRDIVGSTIDLAHKLGMTVVAEGIETEEMRSTLADLGCDLLQGYLFARPVSEAEFISARVAEADVTGAEPALENQPSRQPAVSGLRRIG